MPHVDHRNHHAFAAWRPRAWEGLTLATRRAMLKASWHGLAGLTLPGLLSQRARGETRSSVSREPSVILLWMAGGPSHLDTLDPKPDRPIENRGPFGVIPTRLPGVQICEHLPRLASRLDRFTLVRSVDARFSNHEPNTVFQTGRLDAEPRTNPEAERYPALGSIIAKHRRDRAEGVPPYIVFQTSRSHLAYAGDLGRAYDPFLANRSARLPVYSDIGVDSGQVREGDLLVLPEGLDSGRVRTRRTLRDQVGSISRTLDGSKAVDALDENERQAVEMLTGTRVRQAFDLASEPAKTRDRFGNHLWCQEALLARRLVEAGAAFVTLDLSYHTASGTWDTHGDNIPPYGGISRGLKPLLPLFDHLITTLVEDLTERGLIDQVLVIAMGEFGRTPRLGTQGSTDGRDHWQNAASMLLAGGGLRHGQVIGATERDGGYIAKRPVTPGDLAATILKHMRVPLGGQYLDATGRPRPYLERGSPIGELF